MYRFPSEALSYPAYIPNGHKEFFPWNSSLETQNNIPPCCCIPDCGPVVLRLTLSSLSNEIAFPVDKMNLAKNSKE